MEESKFSILERYGEDFTAKEYVTNPAIGRDKQIRELLLILLTPEKSAILIGKPGIGKTAIVEGLSYAIQQKQVPDALIGYTVINIKTASLLGTMPNGESKVQAMIDELRDREKIILFVDEIHMLIGATDESSLDFANIFKEGLGRGSIKVVGATTTEEYERYILRDKAFTRRFQKVEVPEPNREETINIMMGTLPKIEKMTGAKLKYTNWIKQQIMGFIVDLTSEYKRVYEVGSRYPDISLTLLKQAFSHAVFDNRKEVNIFDVEDAILNTKNVYSDVIKKDMPTFYKMFDAIIKEEKGEVESQDNAPTWDMSANRTITTPIYEDVVLANPEVVEKVEDGSVDVESSDTSKNVEQIEEIQSGVIEPITELSNASQEIEQIEEIKDDMFKPIDETPVISPVVEQIEEVIDGVIEPEMESFERNTLVVPDRNDFSTIPSNAFITIDDEDNNSDEIEFL